MRIAFVIYNYSESKGGVERYAYDLARYLIRDAHDIHIFCHQADESFSQSKIDHLTFHIVPANGLFSFFKYRSFADNAASILSNDKFDLIQGFGRTYSQDVYRVGSGCHWEYLKNRHPSMRNILGRVVQSLNPRNQVIMELEKKSFAPGAYKKIICISKKVKEEIQRYYYIHEKDISVIYNGIDPERFNTGNKKKYHFEVRKELGLNDNEILILFVGSGFERKGLQYAIEGLAFVPENYRSNIKLLVVGKGNVNKYQAIAGKYGIKNQVLFIGPQSRIERYYAASDIFLFPTLYEPFGTVCLEAMASGLPVITTQRAGASEIMSDSIDAFIIPEPLDSKIISEKIIFLSDKIWRENMGKAAALTASKYSFETNFRCVKEIYGEITNKSC
jgi:UDP-glucose:(heptosyl)LPS alpha-1,3-glucosyltransferase